MNIAEYKSLAAESQPAKYHNQKTTVDGITFDSAKEADYFAQLQIMLKAHIVRKFSTQVRYELQPAFMYKGEKMKPINYIADFVVEYADGHVEVVDVKGVRTKEYVLKKKLLLYMYPKMNFVEV